MLRPSLLAIALVLFAFPAPATTRHVPAVYPTIQGAFDASTTGDTIQIACGTYSEVFLSPPSGLVVRGGTSDPSCTVLDFIDDEGLFGSGTIGLSNLTIRNGHPGLSWTGSVTANQVVFNSNGAEHVGLYVTGLSTFTDCNFYNNGSEATPVKLGSGVFTRCVFYRNVSGNSTCGLDFDDAEFIDCWFEENEADVVNAICVGAAIIRRCVFLNNSFDGGSGYPEFTGGALWAGTLDADECLFVGNYISFPGRGSAIGVGGSATIHRCLFVGNDGPEIIACDGPNATVSITCSNIWGNPESNWDGCIAGQFGINGNISEDPRFCDAIANNFSLSSISPCLDAPCGTMGPYGLGCFDQRPGIISIKDVGNDQGRQVRLTWYRSLDDNPADNVSGYGIYRRKDQYAATPPSGKLTPEEAAILGWDYIATVPRRYDDIYQFIAPTLCDSTISAGQCWSAFFVSAVTPTEYFDSPVDSGYSKDNIAPAAPTSLSVNYNTGSGNHLVWSAVAATDFAGFHVYRGTTPGFATTPATLVHTTPLSVWNDGAFDGWNVHYKVRTFDIAGNESIATSAQTVTSTGTPTKFALSLGPANPNPFNPVTSILFSVPSRGRVRMTVYDVSGALVRVLVDRNESAGSYRAEWDGKDQAGNRVSSGVYLCRLEHAAGLKTLKVALLK